MPDTPAVATIIAAYNAAAYLHTCLQALLQGTMVPHIIIVDNASTDDTRTIIATHYADEVHLIANARNEGFGRANNIGIQHALQRGYRYFFLLNQDAYVAPDAVEQLYNACEAAPEWALLSPVHLNGTGTALDHGFDAYLRDAQLSYGQLMQAATYMPIPFVNAAAWMLRRSCIEKTGGFNPVFFHYGEDVNYMHRMHYHGLQAAIWPAAVIRHHRSPHSGPVSRSEERRRYLHFVLMDLANPHSTLTWPQLAGIALRQALRALAGVQWGAARQNIQRLVWLFALAGKPIRRYKKISQQQGLHFLP